MNLFKLFGMAALSLAGSGGILAQNLVSPGELASSSNAVTRRSFDSGVDPLPLVSKHDIANVEDKHDKRVRTIWVASIMAMAGGTTADAISSWHKRESNGLLASSDGTFGAKGVTIKAGIAAGVLVPQFLFRKHRDWHTAFAVGNFAEAGIFTGAAIHNLHVNSLAK